MGVDAMFAWANSRMGSTAICLGKVVHLSGREGLHLTHYFKDGMLEIPNNHVVRSSNLFVIDRKNFLHANTYKRA